MKDIDGKRAIVEVTIYTRPSNRQTYQGPMTALGLGPSFNRIFHSYTVDARPRRLHENMATER